MELEVNFKDISNEMTNMLEEKNKAYGNSFDLTMDKWGTNVAGARLDDKINRIDGMLQDGNLVKNGESLLDNLFDLSGYSFLLIRYLVNKGVFTEDQVRKYFAVLDNQ